MSEEILILKNIVKKYSQGKSVVTILDNANLTVKKSEKIAIIGASGTGKSTLLHIAGLLDEPNSGEVILPEVSFKQKHLIRLHHLGFIYQQHHLLKDFTACENVMLPRLIAGGNEKEAKKEALELLKNLGLSQKIDNMPGELSGGEQQRVAIARSLINKPQIILADEPTGNLDPYTTQEVFNLFLEVASLHKTSIIMVTHNHQIAHKMDKIYELKNNNLSQRLFVNKF